ncbi:MAG: transposase [Firmicutes bacterium]|nr:transposase [Bacillota bacterium]
MNKYRYIQLIIKELSILYEELRKTKRYGYNLLYKTKYRDYTNISKENGLSYTSIENIVLKYLDPIIDEEIEERINNLEAISKDEFSIDKHHKYGVVISDPINNKIVDVLISRKKEDLIKYFESWTDEQRVKIKYFCMNMWGPYKSVAKAVFPKAKVVVDKFHLVARINKSLDEIRKQVQKRVNKVARKKFYMSKTILKKRGEDLIDEEYQKLVEL